MHEGNCGLKFGSVACVLYGNLDGSSGTLYEPKPLTSHPELFYTVNSELVAFSLESCSPEVLAENHFVEGSTYDLSGASRILFCAPTSS